MADSRRHQFNSNHDQYKTADVCLHLLQKMERRLGLLDNNNLRTNRLLTTNPSVPRLHKHSNHLTNNAQDRRVRQ